MIDFLVVGRGLAATTLMHSFHKQHITFKVVGNEDLSNCSKVAAGIWNPIVFKRLTKSWLADEIIPHLNNFYSECEQLFQKKVITQRNIIKPFTEEQEKKLWLKKSKTELQNYLDPEIHSAGSSTYPHCKLSNDFGLVKQCGNLNVADFLQATALFFNDRIWSEAFDHSQLNISSNNVIYKLTLAKNIVFCEGHLVKNNPYFDWIPLKPAKGEVLTLKIPGLELKNDILNRNGFLMGVSEGIYKAGATYSWDDQTEDPTERALQELEEKVKGMISCSYAIEKHQAGIRPSSIDRRPIIGEHPRYKNLFVFNGLGTKGVMLAPYFAENFVNFYLQKESIHSDVNVSRFYNLYDEKR